MYFSFFFWIDDSLKLKNQVDKLVATTSVDVCFVLLVK